MRPPLKSKSGGAPPANWPLGSVWLSLLTDAPCTRVPRLVRGSARLLKFFSPASGAAFGPCRTSFLTRCRRVLVKQCFLLSYWLWEVSQTAPFTKCRVRSFILGSSQQPLSLHLPCVIKTQETLCFHQRHSTSLRPLWENNTCNF